MAQGSGSVATLPSVSGADGSPFQVTRSVTGIVREVSIEKGTIVVEDQKKQAAIELKLAAKVRVAGSSSSSSNKKMLADIMPGSLVRVQYTASGASAKTALEIRILEKGA